MLFHLVFFELCIKLLRRLIGIVFQRCTLWQCTRQQDLESLSMLLLILCWIKRGQVVYIVLVLAFVGDFDDRKAVSVPASFYFSPWVLRFQRADVLLQTASAPFVEVVFLLQKTLRVLKPSGSFEEFPGVIAMLLPLGCGHCVGLLFLEPIL